MLSLFTSDLEIEKVKMKDDEKWAVLAEMVSLTFWRNLLNFLQNYSWIKLKDDGKWAFLAEMVSL